MAVLHNAEKHIEHLVAALALEGDKLRSEWQAGMTQFANGLKVAGARPLPIQRNLGWGGPGRLVGWSVKATGGPVTLLMRDSHAAADGDIIAVIDLVDTENETIWLGESGVSFGEALYLERTGAGTLIGSVWIS